MIAVLSKLHFLIERRHWSLFSWRFAAIAVVVPSLLYTISMLYFCPPRVLFICALSIVVFLGIFINRWAFLALLFAVMAFDAAVFVSSYFQMPLGMIFDSTQYLGALSLRSSAIYLGAMALLAGCLVVTYLVTQHAKKHRRNLSLFPFVLFSVIALAVDGWANTSPQEMMKLQNTALEPFAPVHDAASAAVNLAADFSVAEKPNLLVVIVEGLGAFENPERQNLIWGPLLYPEVQTRFEVATGRAPYFGSTTSAEVRELCNLYGDYRHLREVDSLECLPGQARAAGYKTAAFHAFTGAFFERFDWYPKVGFENLYFMENRAGLPKDVDLSLCGLTFQGMCDADVARSVKLFLTKTDADPKFAYWLTLNSHKPVVPGEAPERLNCDDGGVFGDRELCRMGEQWLNVSHLVYDMALDPALKNTEILLVGDHHPPLFTRHGRAQFHAGEVAWLNLKPRKQSEEKVIYASPAGGSVVQ